MPDVLRLKLLELPLLELGGSTIDLAPVLALAVLFVLALVALLRSRRPSRWRLAIQALSVFVFVFAAHQTMCVLRSWIFGFQAIGRNDTVAFALSHIAAVLIFIALVGGGIFCGWICPVGAIQEWVGRGSAWLKARLSPRTTFGLDVTLSLTALAVMAVLTVRYAPTNFFFSENVSVIFTMAGLVGLPVVLAAPFLDQRLRWFRYVSLFGRIAIILIGIHTTTPGCTLYETEVDYSAAISFLGVMLATVVLSRAYCRYICPFGAAFGLLSTVALLRVEHRQVPCSVDCGRCATVCPVGALQRGAIEHTACTRCGRCIEACGACVRVDMPRPEGVGEPGPEGAPR